jgi:anaerobic selenocysteine-containing dehydrogenase
MATFISSTSHDTQATIRTALRICPLCEACCGLEIQVADNAVISIRGDDNDPFSKGYICPKAVALKDLHSDLDRLRTPLIKRNGKFEVASWDQAFEMISQRLPKIKAHHGSDAIGISVGNPAAHKMGLLLYFGRLARILGSKNVFSASTLDQMPKQLSSGLMFGHWLSIAVPDIDRTNLLIVLGANPMASNGSLWTVPDFRGKAKALKARGGELIVIDPRRTETAEIADQHHFIRPGSDAIFLAAIVNYLFAKNLIKLGALGEHVTGLDAVKNAVESFTPAMAANYCGIDAATIEALTTRLATTERAVLYGRIGTCTQRFGTVASWLIDVINGLTGHLDTVGGAMFPKAPAFASNTQGDGYKGKGIAVGRHHSRVSIAPEVYGELPMGVLAEEIETSGHGQIKALITVASNPVLSSPDGERLSKALASLDFMVSIDIYLNETTRFADVILPGLSPLEEAHYDVAFPQFSYRNQARYSPAVLTPSAEQLAEWQILSRIGEIMGGPASASVPSPSELLDAALKQGPYALSLDTLKASPHGIDLGALQSRIPEMLRTPSGKIELAPESVISDLLQLEKSLSTTVPRWTLIGRRDVRSNNSWMHNLPILAKGPFRCTALMHPTDAQALNLATGAHITVANAKRPTQRLTAEIEITDAMMPGVISLPHGWGHNKQGAQLGIAELRPGVNMNELFIAEDRDVLSGNSVLSGIEVLVTST